jgi:hypothetical protein
LENEVVVIANSAFSQFNVFVNVSLANSLTQELQELLFATISVSNYLLVSYLTVNVAKGAAIFIVIITTEERFAVSI